ncbi:hypothetical protein CBF34_10840 [Vagococcus penaei]|uniref:Uncharacterized protein n=1 Tax=Vagococcus penaei TaxID=633807 RepID=A0A1Q2D5Q7_9ENTE|nr:VanZ family protein [Vagococcus penaei]AQP53692.1 hypothetical protein BW732_05195 [Vagococcus penaei]RST97705.1 hypothetical protein CBF34_10840 [Vagococcus penaei]
MKNIPKEKLFLLVAIGVMLILFFSSAQTYEQQSQVSLLERLLKNEPFKESLSKIVFTYGGSPVSIEADGYFKFIEFFIRKAAHFFTFFVLGGAFYFVLYYQTKRLFLAGLFGWLSATGYAALDEFHQMLTGGRTPLFQDVALDSIGALTACVLIVLITWLKSGKKGQRR